MKPLLFLILFFSFLVATAQDKEFILEGQVIDMKQNPVSDAYVFNIRSSLRDVSRSNGVFQVWALPGDSVIISHISFLRKVVSVYRLMINPIVQLDPDTVNIRPVNVSAGLRTENEIAMENIKRIEFDFRPQPDDTYTETERMQSLMNTENQVQRVASSSLSFTRFSPSEEIGKIFEKRKKKKEAKQFSSTKELEKEGKK